MSSPAKPLRERGEDVGHQDFARCVVTGQVVHGDRQVARTTLGANDIRGGQRCVQIVLPGNELGEDSQDRIPLRGAAGRHIRRKRPSCKFGELSCGAAICCSHVPARSTICRRNAS